MLPYHTLRTTDHGLRWTWAIFDLAWREEPDSPLRAAKDKTVWLRVPNPPDCPAASRVLPYYIRSFSLADYMRHRGTDDTIAREIFAGVPDPPTWYSVLDDVLQASVWAVDILLNFPQSEPAPRESNESTKSMEPTVGVAPSSDPGAIGPKTLGADGMARGEIMPSKLSCVNAIIEAARCLDEIEELTRAANFRNTWKGKDVFQNAAARFREHLVYLNSAFLKLDALRSPARVELRKVRVQLPSRPPVTAYGMTDTYALDVAYRVAERVRKFVERVCPAQEVESATITPEALDLFTGITKDWVTASERERLLAFLDGELQDAIAVFESPSKGTGGAHSTPEQPKHRRRRKTNPEKQAKRAAKQEQEKADRRLWEAWNRGTGHYRALDELAQEKGISRLEVQRALDRHRKRLGRAGKRPPDNLGK